MNEFKNIWTEKYRPKKLSDVIISERTRKLIESYKDEIPNLLFAGSPGTGKTTLALVIVKDVLQCNYLYINASDESGIDTIRNKVSSFAQTKSFDGKVKVVILDEGDGLTIASQQALRNTMETYAKNTRFIITANHKHKIAPAIQSRCQSIDIKPELKEAVRRCHEILKVEDVEIPEDQKAKFVGLIKATFPDLRKTINELQKNSINGVLDISRIGADTELLSTLFKFVSSCDSLKARKYLIDNEERFSGDYDTLLGDFLDHIYTEESLDDIQKKTWIAILADHLHQSVFVVDKEINAFACFINLERA